MAINKKLVGRREGEILPIPVKEWDGIVYAKKLTLGQMEEINKAQNDNIKQTVIALIEILVEEDGKTPIFNVTDYDFLLNEEIGIITNVFNKAMEFNAVDYNKKKES